jgi:hypothetical protein
MFSTLKATQSEPHLFVHNRLGWVIVRFFVAAVLLIAAGLKAYQLATMPDLENSFFEARWFQIILVECEIALALILLFGIVPKISWLVTTILFMIFSIVSLAKGLSGAESCNCWGAVKVNPFITFLLDVGIVALLLFFRPQKLPALAAETNNVPLKTNWFFQTFSLTFVLIVVVLPPIYLFFGSFAGMNQFMNTYEITFAIDENLDSQKKNRVEIFVINHTSRPFTLVGAKTDCSCGTVEGFPLTVNAHEKANISFVTSDKVDKRFRSKEKQKILFFVEDSGTKQISAELPIFEFLVRNEQSL